MLNREKKDAGYLVGRMRALLEMFENSTGNKYSRLNAQLATQAPKAHTRISLDAFTAHAPENIVKEMAEVISGFSGGIPDRLSAEQQQIAAVGYWHERAWLRDNNL